MSWWAGRRGLFQVAAAASAHSLVLEAEAGGATAYLIAPATDKATLLDQIGHALHVPAWAGRNWDALADLIADLSWLPPGPVVLVWEGPDLLAATDPRAYRVAFEVLRAAAGRNTARTVTVLLRTAPS